MRLSRHIRRAAGLILAGLSLLLAGSSIYVVPLGLPEPEAIPTLDGRYTAQIAGFLDIADGQALALAAFGPAQLVVNGNVVARAEDRVVVAAEGPLPPGAQRVLIQFAPMPGEDPPRLYQWSRGGYWEPVPPASLSPRRLPPAAWRLRRVLTPLTFSLAIGWILLGTAVALGYARRWFSSQLSAVPEERRAAWAVMALGLVVFAFPFWWGVPVSWSHDEVWPMDASGLIETLTPGWTSRYPAFHIFVVAIANAPFIAADALGLVDTHSELVFGAMKAITHLVSVAMALGTSAVLIACGTRLRAPRLGILAGLLWTFTLTAVFYGKTANVDVPYTFWFAVALLAYLRALDEGTVRAHVQFAAAGTCALVTKDQAYALFVFPAIHLALTRWRRLGSVAAVIGDRAILLPIAAALVVFAVGHTLPLNWRGFVEHVASITGPASEGYRMIERASLSGQLWLLGVALRQLAWSHTILGVMLAGFGIAAVLATPDDRRRFGPLLVPVASYYVCFIMVVGYSYDRFMLPVSVVLALFAAYGVDRLWPAGGPRWRTFAMAAVLVVVAWRTVSLNLLMAADGRYEVEHWLRTHLPPETRIAVVEAPELLPKLWNFNPLLVQYPAEEFTRLNAPVAIVSDSYRARFAESGPETEWLDALEAGRGGYRVVLRQRGRVPWAIIQWERQFRTPDPSFSSLHKVNPLVTVLFRDGWEPPTGQRSADQ